MTLMRSILRKVRDQPAILATCVACLRLLRALGFMRSKRFYSHVPYRGIVEMSAGSGSFKIMSHGDSIENSLYWDGLYGHEPRTLGMWVEHAARARVVLDVGANSGVFGLAAAAAGAGAVHAFEPLPRVYRILEENFQLNAFPNSTAWPLAVGRTSGSAKIYDPGGNAPSSASLSEEFATQHFGALPSHEVRVISIDDFCAANDVREVDLIKVDVEGYEEHALRGMSATVARCQPAIFMEVLDGHEESLRAVVETLWPGQFCWSRIDEGQDLVSRNVLLDPVSKMVDKKHPSAST